MQYRTAKIGRNDPCPCASGLKYKKCCYESKSLANEEFRLQQFQSDFKKKLEASADSEIVFHQPNSHPVKMSEVILEFAEDMLRHADTNAEIRKAITLACAAWNLALLKEKGEEEACKMQFNSFLDHMRITEQEDIINLKNLVDALIDKKISDYFGINRLIVNFQIDFAGGKLMLNVASTIVPEEINDSERG